jgi:hypothetical protein
MSTSDRDSSVFRIDRFVVPAAAEAEFLAAVTETNTVFEAMDECLQLRLRNGCRPRRYPKPARPSPSNTSR